MPTANSQSLSASSQKFHCTPSVERKDINNLMYILYLAINQQIKARNEFCKNQLTKKEHQQIFDNNHKMYK